MKKTLLLLSLLAVMCATATAQRAPGRMAQSNQHTLKELNETPHRRALLPAKPQGVPMKAIANAPANAISAPFSHDMGKNSADVETVKKYTVIDANGDDRSWKVATVNNYSACMAPNAEGVDASDDWMISVPVLLEKGNYNVSVDLGFLSGTGITCQLLMGTDPTVAGMTTEISPVIVQTVKDQTKYEYTVSVAAEGYYYFGLHNTTTKAQGGAVKYFNLSVEKGIEAPENAIDAPFSHDMGKTNNPNLEIVQKYTVIDANQDTRTWKLAAMSDYTACMAPNAADVDAADDWLITVPVFMTAGNYTVAMDLAYMGTGATGMTIGVKLGTAPTVEGMTAEISPATVLTTNTRTTYEYPCAIPADGYYYIGVHNTTTKAQKATVKFHNLTVKKGEIVKIDPPAAGELSWVLAPKGELKATVTYTAPTKTVTGADLKEISKVVLTSRWGVDKFEYTDVAPGQVIVQDVEMYAGINNRFTAVAYTGDVAGDVVEYKSIFCGPDIPLKPTDVTLTVAPDYKSATLSWTAPGEVGENGGYVDTDKLTYYIFDAFGSYYDPAIATTDKTSYTIDYSDLTEQDFFAYQVTAGVGDNYSLDGVSNIITAGEPAQLPFTESFTDGYYDGIWMSETDGQNLYQQYGTMDDSYFESLMDPEDPESITPLKSHDGDNGFFFWLPVDKNALFGLISVRADISKAANPVLEFWYQGQGSTIDVLLGAGTDEPVVVKTIDLKQNPATGWTLAQVPLAEYKEKGAVQFEIRLLANHNDDEHTWSVPLDDISIRDLADTDLRIFPMSAPAKAAPGTEIKLSAQVENIGKIAAAARAQLFAGEEKVDEIELGTLEPYAFAKAEFTYPVTLIAPEQLDFRIVAVADGDAVAMNNTTTASLTVEYPVFPAVTALTGSPSADNNTVTLSWTAPNWDELKEPVAMKDDFESEDYTPMSISGAGEWTVFDGDKCKTYNIFREYYNPYQTAPMAFQLFNREVAEVSATYWEDAAPHSGNTFMMAPSAQDNLNDNWLISPRLSGREQTITFWAKSCIISWPESFTVYYSTTGNTVDCFTESLKDASGNSAVVPEQWTLFSFTLPAGATYFAICHDSYDSLALLVDDVTYEASPAVPENLEVVGYHVFRNGEQLTAEPVKETTYVDTLPAGSGTVTHDYAVVAAYNHGYARAAHTEVMVTMSGIGQIDIDALTGTETIYNLSGVKVDRKQIVPGVYIVVTPGRAMKAILK